MEMYISDILTKVLQYSKDEAMRTGTYQIGPGHLFLGLLRHGDNEACRMLSECGADMAACKEFLDTRLFKSSSIPYSDEDKITLSRSAENVLSMTMLEASMAGDGEVGAGHLLMALSKSVCTECEGLFSMLGVSYRTLSELHNRGKEDAPENGHSAEEAVETIKEELISVVEMLGDGSKIFS